MENHDFLVKLIEKFKSYFPEETDQEIRFFFAPGRVNLIGEHTDYNGGYVFPAALTLGTYMVIRKRNDQKFIMRSENFQDATVEFNLNEIKKDPDDRWGNYPRGIVKALSALEIPLTGAEVLYEGNIPNGAGLSSSASIGMVTAFGLCQLSGSDLSKKDLVYLCQRVENDFIGVNTGIMDQTAVGFGEKDHAILLNCQTFEIEKIPLHLGDYKILITNTNKRRGLADSKYNERRMECEKGLEVLQESLPELTCLGDVSVDTFQKFESTIGDPVIRARVRHIVTEDDRVLKATHFLKKNELLKFGELMKASHDSLKRDYEVTGLELDALYEAQKSAPGCIGTRMTGAGFGGCTVSLVHNSQIQAFKDEVSRSYSKTTGLEPTFYICEAGKGVSEVKNVSWGRKNKAI